MAVLAEFALIVLLVTAGVLIRRWRALWLAAPMVAGVFVGDVLWVMGFPPFDRDDLQEPLPILFVAVPAVPIALVLLAMGVFAGRVSHRA